MLRIFEKAKLLQFVLERAHTTGLQADTFGGSIAAFSHHYLPRMHRLGYVAPNVGEIPSKAFPGGYVMDSKPGFYDSVVVLDYKSLYPSIIRTFLVDPVGFVEGSNTADPTRVVQGPRGTVFSREKHCLPEIVTTLWRAQGRGQAGQERAAVAGPEAAHELLRRGAGRGRVPLLQSELVSAVPCAGTR